MKTAMTVFISLSLTLMILVGVLTWITVQPRELEIYTLENIYYVDFNQLKVTNENNNEVKVFRTNEELYIYISNVTTDDNQIGYDCLMNRIKDSDSYPKIRLSIPEKHY